MAEDDTGGGRTRTALEAAALAAISEEGWQAAGVRSVTRRAGVPLGAVTYHYGGKEQLFRHVVLEELQRMFATPGRIMSGATSLRELVEQMLAWSGADDVTAQQRLLLLEVMAQSRRDRELSVLLGHALASYRTALADALTRTAGDAAASDATLVAVADAFAAHCDGLWLHSIIEPGFPEQRAATAAAEVWLHALTANPA